MGLLANSSYLLTHITKRKLSATSISNIQWQGRQKFQILQFRKGEMQIKETPVKSSNEIRMGKLQPHFPNPASRFGSWPPGSTLKPLTSGLRVILSFPRNAASSCLQLSSVTSLSSANHLLPFHSPPSAQFRLPMFVLMLLFRILYALNEFYRDSLY